MDDSDRFSVFNSVCNEHAASRSFYQLQNSRWVVEHLTLQACFEAHTGCVNALCWAGESRPYSILSASDDKRLVLTDVFSGKQLVSVKTDHRDNILSARFLSFTNDTRVVSGASDGSVFLTFLDRPNEPVGTFNCACDGGPIYKCRPLVTDSGQVFLTCAEDGIVRRYDTRVCSSCCPVRRSNPIRSILSRIGGSLINREPKCRKYAIVSLRNTGITCVDVADGRNSLEMAIGCSDGRVRLYDMRNCREPFAHYVHPQMVGASPVMSRRRQQAANTSERRPKCHVTCLRYSSSASELLVNFSGNQLQLLNPMNLTQPRLLQGLAGQVTQAGSTTAEDTENENSKADKAAAEARRFKRIRLRGDWTDTGPMARPTGDSAVSTRRVSNVFNALGLSSGSGALLLSTADQLAEDENPEEDHPMEGTRSASESGQSESSDFESARSDSSTESQMSPFDPNQQLEVELVFDSLLVDSGSDTDRRGRGQTDDASPTTRVQAVRDRESEISSEPDYDDDYESNEGESSLSNTGFGTSSMPSLSCRLRSRRPPPNSRTLTSSSVHTPKDESILEHVRTFVGHRNTRTIIKECSFFGYAYVMAGSDCGHIFIWDKVSTRLIAVILADRHVVNCVQPHPLLPMVASSGIDHNIKIWSPSSVDRSIDQGDGLPQFGQLRGGWKELIDRNDEMLQEQQNTITLPDPLLIGILASISRIRDRDPSRRHSNQVHRNNQDSSTN